MDGNRMCRKIYQTARTYAESENWVSRVKKVLHSCGLFQWWENNNCGNLSKKDCKEVIASILFRLKRDEWVKNKPKLRTYQLFK